MIVVLRSISVKVCEHEGWSVCITGDKQMAHRTGDYANASLRSRAYDIRYHKSSLDVFSPQVSLLNPTDRRSSQFENPKPGIGEQAAEYNNASCCAQIFRPKAYW